MTELLYLRDLQAAYAREFQATVVKSTGRYVVLDRTLFYPLGGGQEPDHGQLRWDGGAAQVAEVTKKGDVFHYLSTPASTPLAVGTVVDGAIDWGRRYAHMRMHTSQHLVSGIAFDLFRASTVGNQLHADRSRIDLSGERLSDEDVLTLESSVNQALGQRLRITAREIDRSELEAQIDPKRVNLTLLPKAVQQLRIIEIGSLDTCPCAGTHVENTGEIGTIRILKRESKGDRTQRVTYELESPAGAVGPEPGSAAGADPADASR